MSSPLLAETACSRISPYLAYGNLSVREVLQFVRDNFYKQKNVIFHKIFQISFGLERSFWAKTRG